MASRAYALGSSLAKIGGAGAGGLVPAFAMDTVYENWDYAKDNWWVYPALMLLAGGLLCWKGLDWMKPVGYGLVGAAFFQGYRGYKEEASGAGNVMFPRTQDAGSMLMPGGYQDAGALPQHNPYRHYYSHATQTAYPYAA